MQIIYNFTGELKPDFDFISHKKAGRKWILLSMSRKYFDIQASSGRLFLVYGWVHDDKCDEGMNENEC